METGEQVPFQDSEVLSVGSAWEFGGNVKDVSSISIDDASKVLDYHVAKEELFLQDGQRVNAWSLVRQDPRIVLYPAVGCDYTVIQNRAFLDRLHNQVLAPELNLTWIESCGILSGGQRAFVSVFVDRFRIAGDDSDMLTRLTFINSFGGASLWAALTASRLSRSQNVGTVLRVARAQGAANLTLKNFRHTRKVGDRITDYIVDLAGVREQVQNFRKSLSMATEVHLSHFAALEILEQVFPVSLDEDGEEKEKSAKIQRERHDDVMRIWTDGIGTSGVLADTAYALFMSICTYVDSYVPTKARSSHYRWHASINGTLDGIKQRAFEIICPESFETVNPN